MPAPLAVSMGDPAGIGLELVARVLADRQGAPPFFLVGDAGAFERACKRLQLPTPNLRVVHSTREAASASDGFCVLATPLAVAETPGQPDRRNAPAIIGAIATAVGAVRDGAASAIVTLPIAKSVLQSSGFAFPGHTEYLAALTQSDAIAGERGPVMLLAGASLKVALVTIHTPLARVAEQISTQRIVNVGRVLGQSLMRDFAIARPRIALCGLNPHAGEAGHIGREELEIVNPAAAQLRAQGWAVSDAQSADALFHDAARTAYDAVLALYHDQGLIPIKTLHFWDAVNVTLGLPIVRTSPDHGTGFDIAGKGIARADSFRAALRVASEIAARRGRA